MRNFENFVANVNTVENRDPLGKCGIALHDATDTKATAIEVLEKLNDSRDMMSAEAYLNAVANIIHNVDNAEKHESLVKHNRNCVNIMKNYIKENAVSGNVFTYWSIRNLSRELELRNLNPNYYGNRVYCGNNFYREVFRELIEENFMEMVIDYEQGVTKPRLIKYFVVK